MSILTIAQNIAREVGFTTPTSLVGSQDETSIQLLQLISTETNDLSNGVIAGQTSPMNFNWQSLVKRGTFNFISGQEAYSLPTDFKDFIDKTIWNYSIRRPLIAPITAQEFEVQKNYLITSGIDKMIYVYNNQIHVVPTPSSTDTINYEYTTTYIFQSNIGVGQTAVQADTDVCTISEFLVQLGAKVRYLITKSLINPENFGASFEYQNYIASVQRAILKDGFGQKSPITMSRKGNAFWLAASTQDSNWPAS